MNIDRIVVGRALSSAVALCVLFCLGFNTVAQAAPPANDNFANAQVVGPALPVVVAASNVDATAEPSEPAIFSNAAISTVWFRWTAPANGTVVVDLCGAGFTGSASPFEAFAVRTGATLNSLTLVAEMAGECSRRFTAVSGTQYSIQVDYRNDQGNFTFRMRQMTPPGNDNFASAQTIGPGLPIAINATNRDSTWQSGEPGLLGGSSSSRSVWFNWTAGFAGRVRLDICDFTAVVGPSNRAIGVYTGNSLGTLSPTITSGGNCQLDFNTIFGQTYRIAFSGNLVGEGDFVLRLESAPLPPNDDFSNSQAVGPDIPVLVGGDNTFATAQAGEPAHNGIGAAARSVWFSWTPAANVRVRIGMCSKSFGGRIGVYTGAAVNGLTVVGELPPFAPHCRIILDAIAGTTYRIAAAGGPQDNAFGPFELDIHELKVPANDDFAAARSIGSALPLLIGGTTVDASKQVSEPSHDPENSEQLASVWYRWKAGSAARTTLSACSSVEPVRIAVYTGTSLATLKRVITSDKGCAAGTSGGKVSIRPKRGTVYRIVVASVDQDFDSRFRLSVTAKYRYNLPKALVRCRKLGNRKARARCARTARRRAATAKCRSALKPATSRKCLAGVKQRFS